MRSWLVGFPGLLLLAGCGAPQPYVTADRLERGLVVVLPGVEGRGRFNEAICDGLNDGGVNWAIELYDWTVWGGPLYNLRNRSGNRQKADDLADRIARYREQCPGRPVVLLGQSGGGALAVWTTEALGPGVEVDGVILLAAALSPRYTLDAALRRSRRGILSFYSERDWVLLGTAIAGTMDGDFAASAGRTGFEVPGGDDPPETYRKLFQVAWNQKMSETGHYGLHITSGASEFVSAYVAPFIRSAVWREELVAKVLRGEPVEGPPEVPPLEWKPLPSTGPATSPATAPATSPAQTRPAGAAR
ncbi:MAG TPA: alpha/beta hydrolase [Phycisphaerae bacterium]|nr:alpha/beta hydrolase [Phycisphaerae bacterium]HUU60619.1 alpha/beta hydrolase [Phycisphaerae bacterium]